MAEFKNKSTVFAAIRYRRSVRNYSNKSIEDWKLNMILESARLAPSSNNSQPLRLIVIKDDRNKEFLANATPDKFSSFKWLNDCPVILIICASKSKIQKAAQLIGLNYHLVDIGIAGEHICIVASELGLGTCWIGYINKKKIKQEFNIPNSWEVISLISLGYPKDLDETIDVQELTQKFGSYKPIQEQGEIGIGNIKSKKRKSNKELIFYEKL